MPDLRQIKAKARADLHQAMRVRAFYYAPGTDEVNNPTPPTVYVRVHSDNKALADLKGTNFSYAEDRTMVPKLIFWLADRIPQQFAVVMISAEEGYRIDNLDPVDFVTQTAYVEHLRPEDLANYSYPGA